MVICDTLAHLHYYQKTFGIQEKKMRVLEVGVNTDEFYPLPGAGNQSLFNVGFYGSFNPLQGTEKIMEAAFLLKEEKDIRFTIIGSGADFDKIKKLADETYQLSNVSFHGWIDYRELNTKMNAFDICLGIFGDTKKADLVIPNKIYHYAAVKKAIISKSTIAIKEVFTDGKDIVLVDGSRESIAKAILQLKNDVSLQNSIAERGYELISGEYNQNKIGATLVSICREALRK